jgi:hypothetical protein
MCRVGAPSLLRLASDALYCLHPRPPTRKQYPRAKEYILLALLAVLFHEQRVGTCRIQLNLAMAPVAAIPSKAACWQLWNHHRQGFSLNTKSITKLTLDYSSRD